MLKLVIVLTSCCALLSVVGCQTLPDEALVTAKKLEAPQETPFPLSINVFSSYISKQTASECDSQRPTDMVCRNDGIAATDFLTTLENLKLFKELSPSVTRHDYELLIANQLISPAQTSKMKAAQVQKSFTEFSIEWRGVSIDSHTITYSHSEGVETQDIQQILLQWWQYAEQKGVFTTPYLYAALNASDYTGALSLPEKLDGFTLAQRYMYPDPFKGVIARYLHPQFSEAILDVSVYPLLSPLSSSGDPEMLVKELTKAVSQAQKVATARAMQLTIQQENTTFGIDTPFIQGVMSEIAAENDTGEALFASIYVFQMQDKIVKFSTTFPARIGDALVKEALPQIQVPAESGLMKELRLAL